jgi:hypothetical protein
MNLETGRAWAIKESLREFWQQPTREAALAHWTPWYRWATHSRLLPVIKTAKTIHRQLHNVLTFFTHRITNAVAEGLNSKIQTIKLAAAAFVILWSLFVLLPLFALAPALMAARGRAIPAYSALVGEQGRLVHRRWILREPVDDTPLLDAPEIGPVADAATMYDAVRHMRVIPIGKGTIVKILVPIVLPMIVVAALQIPLKDLLLKLVKTLL